MQTSSTAVEPVVKAVTVELPIEEAFELFTTGMAEWWPLETHSITADTFEGRVTAEDVEFAEHEGGEIVEVMSDGSKAAWGTVLEWGPPRRVRFSWKPNLGAGPSTEIDVDFTADGGATKVELTHRGWERFGTAGKECREPYESGWQPVLELYRASAAVKREEQGGLPTR
jgi:uncharacterized protein YndB with AHSA1/START domain